jgi:hypothetical protein
MEKLCVLNGLEKVRALIAEEKLRKSLDISELEKVRLMEEVIWLNKGDKCTKFFHRVTNSNRRNNSIEAVSKWLSPF